MTIAAGTRLGPYEVVAPVGAGGMGEVYRGTDTRLNRVVALKILPSHLSSNAELRERFDREARAISSLSHPNICTLYDVGHHDGTDYLVMEFVEGESLADRLNKGPLPIEQVFRYGIEIADALDKAHRQGIVHRDLKPSNIMITKSGAKLLDFGLAKMATQDSPVVQLSHLPTAQRQLTQEGTILGTFQYMAPEQLEGLEADARTDIFAFGTVLYEMTTGKRAFEGKTKTSLIAAIVDRDPPPISTIQPLTPPAFERVVKTCLAKDPDDRWQSARDVANELRWIRQSASQAVVAAPVVARRRTREWVAWAIAVSAVVTAAAFAYLHHRVTAQSPAVIQSSLLAPEKAAFAFRGPTGGFAISPDGQRIAFLALSEGKTMLWWRPLNTLVGQPVPGSEDARFPFWSPDSRFLAFFSGGKLKKIDVTGGPPQVVCDVGSQPRGGSWGKNGIILLAANTREGLSKVTAAGGAVSAVTKLEKTEFTHRWPSFLPDGRHFFYVAQNFVGNPNTRNMAYIGSLDSAERQPLFATSGAVAYAAPGYIVFPRQNTLFAQRFDISKLRPEGDAVPIADGIQIFPTTLTAMFSLSDTGILAYERAENITGLQLILVDRKGKELDALTPPGNFSHPKLSHDGKRIAYEQQDGGVGADIWVLDLTRRVPTRLTFEPEDETNPIWSPDDSKIIYSGPQPTGNFDVFEKASSGTTPAERLWGVNVVVLPAQWTADGTLLYWSLEAKANNFDIGRFSLQTRNSMPLVASKFDDITPQLSPDGRWLAYASNVSARMEIYIEPYPPSGAKWQVSNGGATSPRWRGDGKELFFQSNDDRIMSVAVTAGADGLRISTPSPLFQMRTRSGTFQYDVSADGQKFLLDAAKGGDDKTTITLVTNWTSSLR